MGATDTAAIPFYRAATAAADRRKTPSPSLAPSRDAAAGAGVSETEVGAGLVAWRHEVQEAASVATAAAPPLPSVTTAASNAAVADVGNCEPPRCSQTTLRGPHCDGDNKTRGPRYPTLAAERRTGAHQKRHRESAREKFQSLHSVTAAPVFLRTHANSGGAST